VKCKPTPRQEHGDRRTERNGMLLVGSGKEHIEPE